MQGKNLERDFRGNTKTKNTTVYLTISLIILIIILFQGQIIFVLPVSLAENTGGSEDDSRMEVFECKNYYLTDESLIKVLTDWCIDK